MSLQKHISEIRSLFAYQRHTGANVEIYHHDPKEVLNLAGEMGLDINAYSSPNTVKGRTTTHWVEYKSEAVNIIIEFAQ
jgi:hypothetical protein